MSSLLPREKLKKYGVENLTDLELLQIMIGSGNKQTSAKLIAKRLLGLLKNQKGSIAYEDVLKIPGMGPAKTCEIVALFELGRRYLIPANRPIIENPKDAFMQLEYLAAKKQECFAILTLDGANRLISNEVVFVGTLNQSFIHPREIFAKAIEDRAASIILAHNHPSGSLEPSVEDKDITEKLEQIGELLGIKVLDHLIVTTQGFCSLKEFF